MRRDVQFRHERVAGHSIGVERMHCEAHPPPRREVAALEHDLPLQLRLGEMEVPECLAQCVARPAAFRVPALDLGTMHERPRCADHLRKSKRDGAICVHRGRKPRALGISRYGGTSLLALRRVFRRGGGERQRHVPGMPRGDLGPVAHVMAPHEETRREHVDSQNAVFLFALRGVVVHRHAAPNLQAAGVYHGEVLLPDEEVIAQRPVDMP